MELVLFRIPLEREIGRPISPELLNRELLYGDPLLKWERTAELTERGVSYETSYHPESRNAPLFGADFQGQVGTLWRRPKLGSSSGHPSSGHSDYPPRITPR
jgi:hypothetical protein